MRRNLGTTDRVARAAIGIALIGLLLNLQGPLRWFGAIGLVLLVTAVAGWCPIYRLIGIRTDDNGPARRA